MELARVQEAMDWAAEVHRGCWRDGSDPLPYISHPIEVVSYLRYIGRITQVDVLCAGALHDTIEEGGTTETAISDRFGVRVAELVVMMTRYEPTEAEREGKTKEEVWRLRHDTMMEEIRTQMDSDAQAIKLADRLSNLRAALVTRTGKKLDRYLWQTEEMLRIIPKKVNEPLWQQIKMLL